METEVNQQIFLQLVLLHMARDNLCNGSLLINKTSPHGLLQIPLYMQLSTTINGSVMFLTCQLPKWLIKQLPLLSLLVQITVIMVQPISISELLDIFQYQLLKLSGQPEVLLTLRTLLKLLLMLLLKQLGTLMLPFSKKNAKMDAFAAAFSPPKAPTVPPLPNMPWTPAPYSGYLKQTPS